MLLEVLSDAAVLGLVVTFAFALRDWRPPIWR